MLLRRTQHMAIATPPGDYGAPAESSAFAGMLMSRVLRRRKRSFDGPVVLATTGRADKDRRGRSGPLVLEELLGWMTTAWVATSHCRSLGCPRRGWRRFAPTKGATSRVPSLVAGCCLLETGQISTLAFEVRGTTVEGRLRRELPPRTPEIPIRQKELRVPLTCVLLVLGQ